jgi:hypothetical protein
VTDTPNSAIPYVPEGTLDPAAGINLSLDVIDALLQTAVISMALTAPPGSPHDGDLYVPATPATGAWAGLEDHLVRYRVLGNFWQSFAPGVQVKVLLNLADRGLYTFDPSSTSTGWTLAAGLNDAPSDGSTYGRRNGVWQPVAGSGGSGGVSIGKQMASAYTPSITDPTDISFVMVLQSKIIEPMAPRLQMFLDDFMQDCGFFTTSGNTTTPAYANSQISLQSTAASGGNAMDLRYKQKFEQPGICLMLEGIVPTPDTGFNALVVSFRRDANNVLFVFMEKGSGSNNNITLAKVVSGSYTGLSSTSNSSLPSGIEGLALEVSPSGVCTVWQRVSALGWEPILTATVSDFNFLSPTELALWVPDLQVTGGVTVPWKVGAFRTGYQGQHHLRDFRIVTLLDGTPYVSDGFLYFTATTDQCSVFRMNPKNGVTEKVGALTFDRSGTHYADLNAHILYDRENEQWRIFWATWGSGSFTDVRIWHAVYKGDVLNGVHLITGGSQLMLSQTSGNNATYDAAVVWDAANSRWLMAYTLSPNGTFSGNFYAVLDESADLVTWSNVFAKSSTTGYEGSWLANIGGEYYVISGNGSNFRCWNATGSDLGTMTVDAFPSPSSNPPPHLIVFPWFDNGLTEYYALSWNNTQYSVGGSAQGVFATGTPILYKAQDTEVGFEFDAIGVR